MQDVEVRALAQALAAELSEQLVAQLASLLERTSQGPPAGPAPAVFRREGDYWTLGYDGSLTRLHDRRGLQHLGRLLSRPNEQVHVLELVDGGAVCPRRQEIGLEVLDPQARAAYRRRLHELEEEVEDAAARADLALHERVSAERDFLVRELARAVGLGGRDRTSGGAVERARVAVTKAVGAAIAAVQEQHPSLCAHLARTVHTGTFCSYSSDPAPLWQCCGVEARRGPWPLGASCGARARSGRRRQDGDQLDVLGHGEHMQAVMTVDTGMSAACSPLPHGLGHGRVRQMCDITRPAHRVATFSEAPGTACRYRSVVWIDSCPAKSRTVRRSTPADQPVNRRRRTTS